MMDTDSGVRKLYNSLDFSTPDFVPNQYIQKVVAECVGLTELQQKKQYLQKLAEECSTTLKQNVYHNCSPLIAAYRETSNIESEIYQTGHLIGEQKDFLSYLLDISVLNDKTPSARPEVLAVKCEKIGQEAELVQLAETVEGLSELLSSDRKQFLYHCNILELDPADFSALARLKALIFTDIFVLATWKPHARGHQRYLVKSTYKQEEVAVVNVRNLEPVKDAFKILLPYETRVFQCADAETKVKVMKAFEEAKQIRLKPMQKPSSLPVPVTAKIEVHSKLDKVLFDEEEIKHTDNAAVALEEEILAEFDKLDILVVERTFEKAIERFEILKKRIKDSEEKINDTIKKKLEKCEEALILLLCREMEPISGCSVRKPKTVKRAMQLLIRLQRTALANRWYINYCNAILKEQVRDVRLDADVHNYVMKIANVYGNHVKHSTRLFLQVAGNGLNVSYIIVWARDSLLDLCAIMKKQIFSTETPILVVSQCVNSLRRYFTELAEAVGFDLTFDFENQIRSPLDQCIRATRAKFLDATMVRAQEESWKAVNLLNLAAANKFKSEMFDLGVKSSLDSFIKDDVQLQLTQSTFQFAKGFLTFAKASISMARTQYMQKLVEDILVEAGNFHLKHIESRFNKKKDEKQELFIRMNASFLLEMVIPVVEDKCITFWSRPAANLQRLIHTFSHLTLEDGKDRFL
ncbi:exocyst complex component 8-like isoform X1 [Artemia franciscana]|uniref:exocyst complex component 8-like isoform X1 n=1 Tax=Artemia franciscana TaxID=6661 RepID=UPI0032DB5FD6